VPAALGAAVVAALVGAAPALSSEGPPTGVPPLPTGATPVVIPPLPIQGTPGHLTARPSIRRARLVPRRVRTGKRSTLRLSLSAPGTVRVVMRRMSKPHRGRVATLHKTASGTKLTIRLPKRAHGRKLARGRYRISIMMADAQGGRSRTVRRMLVIR
jgi:hypothetical protein